MDRYPYGGDERWKPMTRNKEQFLEHGATRYRDTLSPPVDYRSTRPDYGYCDLRRDTSAVGAQEPWYSLPGLEIDSRVNRPGKPGGWENNAIRSTYLATEPDIDYSIRPKWDLAPMVNENDRKREGSDIDGQYASHPRAGSIGSRNQLSEHFSGINNRRGVTKEGSRDREETNGSLYPRLDKPFQMAITNGFLTRSETSRHKYSRSQLSVESTNSQATHMWIRVLVILLILWDLANDWVLNALGPSVYNKVNKISCRVNTNLTELFSVSASRIDGTICSDPTPLFTALSVFVIVASVITVVQSINIVVECLYLGNFPPKSPTLRGQTEVFLAIFLEEVPQQLLSSILLVSCECSSDRLNFNLFSLLCSISAVVGLTIRFSTCFPYVTHDDGCCNQWWRCCCCHDEEYCCKVTARDIFCKWEIPVPLFCCTFRCNKNTCYTVSWFSGLMKRLGCFCACCRDDDVDYGIRLVNVLGLLFLWLFVILQIIIISV